jgi:hypothetical protein
MIKETAEELFGPHIIALAVLLHLAQRSKELNDGAFKDGWDSAIEEAGAYIDSIAKDGRDTMQTLMEQIVGLMMRKVINEELATAEPLTGVVAMKDWNDEKQYWIATVCQAFRYADGTEGIVVYDVGHAETQVEIDDWTRNSLATKPWENELTRD